MAKLNKVQDSVSRNKSSLANSLYFMYNLASSLVQNSKSLNKLMNNIVHGTYLMGLVWSTVWC